MSDLQVKGTHLIQVRNYLDAHLGAGAYDALAAAEGSDGPRLLPGAWYEVRPLVRVLEAAAKKLGTDLTRLATNIARRNAFADLPSVYRAYLRGGNPSRLLAVTPMLWRTYASFGEGRVIVNEVGRYVGQCAGMPEELVPWVSGGWLGFTPAAIELCGGRPKTVRMLRTSKQHSSATFQIEVTYS